MPTVFLLLIARIILAGDHLEKEIALKSDFVNMDAWADELDSISEGHPILFANKYHNLSTYSFSKDRWVPGAPHYYSRFSQIDLNKIDSIYNGKKVFALNYGDQKKWQSSNNTKHRGSFINDYYSYTGLIIDSINLNTINDSLFLNFTLINQTNKPFIFKKDKKQRLQLNYSINNYKHKRYFSNLSKTEIIKPFENMQFQLLINDSLDLSNLNLDIGLSSNSMRVFRLRTMKYNIK